LSYVRYDKISGNFYWIRNAGKCKIGQICGSLNLGYITIRIDGVRYQAHRLAWFINYWYLPDQIDHINGVKHDNRLENLRECSYVENAQNIYGPHSNNFRTGLVGVAYHINSGLYQAKIRVDGDRISLGYFKTAIEAHNAYVIAKRKLHPFNNM
jgi:hypothetical protein